MSQDNRYQFHMGCGEALCSRWWQLAVPAPVARKTTPARVPKGTASGKAQGPRKA